MPFTVNKKLSIQPAGSNSGVWGAGSTGNDLNTGVIGLLDTIVAGISTISQASGTYNLTFVVGGGGDVSNCMLRFTAAPLTNNLVVQPAAGDATTYFNGFYMFENVTSGAFSITVQNAAGSIVLTQGRRGVFFVDATNGPRIVSICNVGTSAADIPQGTNVAAFLQASVPSGWTQFTTLNDYALRLVNGTGAGTHGSTAFSTCFNQASTANYTLQIADIPSHTHDVKYNLAGPFAQPAGATSLVTAITPSGTTTGAAAAVATGGGGPHAHPISLQPFYVDLISGTKN